MRIKLIKIFEDEKNHGKLDNIEKSLLSMLPKLKDYVNKSDMNYFEELVLHNECGIALEEIVATILVHKIPIDSSCCEKINDIGLQLEIQDNLWNKLKELIV